MLYDSIFKINPKYYLDCWILYMDLIETKKNPENYDFYDWGLVFIEHSYRNNLENNMNEIIKLVHQYVIDITNKTEGYFVENGEVFLDLGLINCPTCHSIIDTYGYCNCYY